MAKQTESIDRLFLELSQFTTATTERESILRNKLDNRWEYLSDVNNILGVALESLDKGQEIQPNSRLHNQIRYLHERANTLRETREQR